MNPQLLVEGALRDVRLQLPHVQSFAAYKPLIWPRYTPAPHIALLDQYLEQVTRYVETEGQEGIGRLLVEMPPRHSKSLNVSQLYPTWHLGRNPHHSMILASYGDDLAQSFSRKARNMMQSRVYRQLFPGIKIDSDSKSVSSWGINGLGTFSAMGWGGAATGKDANILIIDDPIRSAEDAESQRYRDSLWEAYTTSLYTRLMKGGAVICVNTRWHGDDLGGRLLKQGGWTELVFPALAVGDHDALGRAEGDALWPEQFDVAALLDIRATIGERRFEALYQQHPTPLEGGMFKRAALTLMSESSLPKLLQIVRYWDLAMSARQSADYTVGCKVGIDAQGRRYVLDVERFQAEWGDVVPRMAQVIESDGVNVTQGIEQQGFMSRAIKELNADTRFNAYTIRGYPKDVDKRTNASPAAAKVAAGLVFVVQSGWTENFLDEIGAFPFAAHDDQVDAFAGAMGMLGLAHDDASLYGGFSYAPQR